MQAKEEAGHSRAEEVPARRRLRPHPGGAFSLFLKKVNPFYPGSRRPGRARVLPSRLPRNPLPKALPG
jgi:hypothetical protein